MGKSAVGLVASFSQVVDPKGDQPPYVRGKRVARKSEKVIKLNTCVAGKLKGKKFGSRAEVRRAFADAVRECKRELGI